MLTTYVHCFLEKLGLCGDCLGGSVLTIHGWLDAHLDTSKQCPQPSLQSFTDTHTPWAPEQHGFEGWVLYTRDQMGRTTLVKLWHPNTKSETGFKFTLSRDSRRSFKFLLTVWRHCCHIGTAMKHSVPDRVKPSFVIFDIRALWRSKLSVRVPGCQKLQMTA